MYLSVYTATPVWVLCEDLDPHMPCMSFPPSLTSRWGAKCVLKWTISCYISFFIICDREEVDDVAEEEVVEKAQECCNQIVSSHHCYCPSLFLGHKQMYLTQSIECRHGQLGTNWTCSFRAAALTNNPCCPLNIIRKHCLPFKIPVN